MAITGKFHAMTQSDKKYITLLTEFDWGVLYHDNMPKTYPRYACPEVNACDKPVHTKEVHRFNLICDMTMK